MMTNFSKVSTKGQTTIPRTIREIAQISTGDLLAWEVDDDGSIRMRRINPVDVAYLRGLEKTLSEWCSEVDNKEYRDL